MKQVPSVLTIAGSDSSGGAGIQADIKTISAHELFATSVITSITAQNSKGVQAVFDLSSEEVEEQLKAVLEDGKPAAVKTGMLGNEALVEIGGEQEQDAEGDEGDDAIGGVERGEVDDEDFDDGDSE